MLNASASGGGALDPNNRGAFSSPFTAAPGQGAGNAFPPHGAHTPCGAERLAHSIPPTLAGLRLARRSTKSIRSKP